MRGLFIVPGGLTYSLLLCLGAGVLGSCDKSDQTAVPPETHPAEHAAGVGRATAVSETRDSHGSVVASGPCQSGRYVVDPGLRPARAEYPNGQARACLGRRNGYAIRAAADSCGRPHLSSSNVSATNSPGTGWLSLNCSGSRISNRRNALLISCPPQNGVLNPFER